MAQPKDPEGAGRRGLPARTSVQREQQLVSLAFDLAEKQIRAGTASSQVITQFLKLGSTREQLEQQRLEYENKLTETKIEALKSAERVEAMYKDALNAMRSYSGAEPPPPPIFDED